MKKNNTISPSIDLYFKGDIQISDGVWDLDDNSFLHYNIKSLSISTFDTSENYCGLNSTISIQYECDFGFNAGYEYSSFYIKFTINWGKNSSGNFVFVQSANSNGTITLSKPKSFVNNIKEIVPEITVSGQLYSKISGGGEVPEPSEVAEEEEYYARGRVTAVDGVFIRSGPGTEFGKEGGLAYGQEFDILSKATRYDNNKVWYGTYNGYIISDYVEIIKEEDS